MDPVTSYWVKIVAGTAAFVVWLVSVTAINGTHFIVMDGAAQQVLFLAACAAFGWGVVQGSTAVHDAASRGL